MDVYSVEKLMQKTRMVAAEYYKLTGQPLPVSNELARYDVTKILPFREPKTIKSGVDLEGFDEWEGTYIQVKARVIFDDKNNRQRIGQLKMESTWDAVALVIFNIDYEPVEIYIANRETIEDAVEEKQNANRNKRGAMSVAKFKKLAEKVWSLN